MDKHDRLIEFIEQQIHVSEYARKMINKKCELKSVNSLSISSVNFIRQAKSKNRLIENDRKLY